MVKLKNTGNESITLFVNIEHGTKHVPVKPGEIVEVSQAEATRAKQIYEGNVEEVQEETPAKPEGLEAETLKETAKKKKK